MDGEDTALGDVPPRRDSEDEPPPPPPEVPAAVHLFKPSPSPPRKAHPDPLDMNAEPLHEAAADEARPTAAASADDADLDAPPAPPTPYTPGDSNTPLPAPPLLTPGLSMDAVAVPPEVQEEDEAQGEPEVEPEPEPEPEVVATAGANGDGSQDNRPGQPPLEDPAASAPAGDNDEVAAPAEASDEIHANDGGRLDDVSQAATLDPHDADGEPNNVDATSTAAVSNGEEADGAAVLPEEAPRTVPSAAVPTAATAAAAPDEAEYGFDDTTQDEPGDDQGDDVANPGEGGADAPMVGNGAEAETVANASEGEDDSVEHAEMAPVHSDTTAAGPVEVVVDDGASAEDAEDGPAAAHSDVGEDHSGPAATVDELVIERVERAKKEYLADILKDWQEDNPGVDHKTSDDWAREMESALIDFYEELEDDDAEVDDSRLTPKDTPAAAAAAVAADAPAVQVDAPTPWRASEADSRTWPSIDVAEAAPAAKKESVQSDGEPIAPLLTELTGWFRKSRGEDGSKAGTKNKRFFALNSFMIKYYTKEPLHGKRQKERGRIQLTPQTQVAATPGMLMLHNPERTWKLQTDDQELVDRWAAEIVKVVAQLSDSAASKTAPVAAIAEQDKKDRSKPKAADKSKLKPAKKSKQSQDLSNEAPAQSSLAAVFAGGAAEGGKFKGHVHGGIRQGVGIGGFTKTNLTPTAEAQAAIKAAKGKANLIVLKVEVEGMLLQLCSASACPVSAEALRERIVAKEPRYYFAVDGSKVRAFVYCCPDDSPRKPRMLYSTGKASAIEQVTKIFGSAPTSTSEISEAGDLDDDELRPTAASVRKKRDAARAAPPVAAKPTSGPVLQQPSQMRGSLSHFMAQELGDKAAPSVRKKVIILPDSARS